MDITGSNSFLFFLLLFSLNVTIYVKWVCCQTKWKLTVWQPWSLQSSSRSEDAAGRSSNVQSAFSSLLHSLPRGLKEQIFLHLQLLVGAFAGCYAEGFCTLDPCTLWVALKNTKATETEQLSASSESSAADLSWFSDYSLIFPSASVCFWQFP